MPLIELSTALVAAGSSVVVPFVNKVLENSAERLGSRVSKQFIALFTRAYAYHSATGREPQPIGPKLIEPILNNAPLEDDPTLADLWAALLANAADPGAPEQVKVGFTEVLRQLEPSDTIILNMLYFKRDGTLIDEVDALETSILDTEVFDNMKDYHSIDYLKARASFDNLIRLRLCVEAEAVVRALPHASGYRRKATDFGFRFMRACTAPKA